MVESIQCIIKSWKGHGEEYASGRNRENRDRGRKLQKGETGEHLTKDKIFFKKKKVDSIREIHLVNVRYKELSWVNHIHIWSLSIIENVPSIDS